MATTKAAHYSYGEYDEIAFMSRNDMNLAVWEGDGRMRLYTYTYKDPFKERMGRFLHFGLTQLWDNHQMLDLKVLVGGQMFRCHGLVMASFSGFFKSELTSEERKRQRSSGEMDTIVLDDTQVSPETFQMLLDMIYQGKDVIQDHTAYDLMKAATYLKIKSLEFRCLDVLVKQLGESSCLKIWDWAEANNLANLASKAKGVALSFFQVLRHTEDFLRMPPERLTMMLGHELLKYRYEDDLLEAILDWVEFDKTDRRQHLKELLPFVCFPYLSTRYLNELRKHDLIGLRSEFSTYLDEALTFHLATLQPDGKLIQADILKRQMQSLKRLMPNMRRVVLLIGGAVVHEEPLTTVVACYLEMAHPMSRYGEMLQFSIASLPISLGLRFASAEWKHKIYVCGGSRCPDALLVYKPNENGWHKLKEMPEGREDHAMVATDGKLYVLGGRGASKSGIKVISDISRYDIEAKVWNPAGQLPLAVEAAPAVLLADKIYVFGGRTASGKAVAVVQQLDLVTGHSRVAGRLPEEVEGARAIVLGKDMILVCPSGAIYTIRESPKAHEMTLTDDFDHEERSFLASLEPISTTDEEKEEQQRKMEEERQRKMEEEQQRKMEEEQQRKIEDEWQKERMEKEQKEMEEQQKIEVQKQEQQKLEEQKKMEESHPEQVPEKEEKEEKKEEEAAEVARGKWDAQRKEWVLKLQENLTKAGQGNTQKSAQEEKSKETSVAAAAASVSAAAASAAVDETAEGEDEDEEIITKDIDEKEATANPTDTNNAAAEADSESEDERDEAEKAKEEESSDDDDDEESIIKKNVDDENIMNNFEEARGEEPKEEEDESTEEEEEEGNEKEEEEEDNERIDQARALSEMEILAKNGPGDLVITKVATMEKRRDFGLFIHKANAMVVGGQSENGYFLDDVLKIHIPTGQVSKMDGKLNIPISGMQVECSAIHQNFLLQFFDATSCFYGE